MTGFTPIEVGVLSLLGGAALWASRHHISVRGAMRFAAVLLFVAATAIATLGTAFSLGSGNGIARTIANSRSVEASFHDAAKFVEAFRQEHSRLPSRAEFDEQFARRHAHRLWIEAPPSSPEAISKLGQPAASEYLLVCWRLWRWAERFAPVG